MHTKSSLIFTTVFAVLLLAVAAKAEETTVQVDTRECVEREVLMVVRSTRNVHYSERDEGRLISPNPVKVKDCGGALVVDTTTTSGSDAPARRTICPPGVQDCIRP